MELLTREQILGAEDIPYEEVETPGWGGTVGVQGLTGRARDAFEVSCTEEKPDGKKTRVKMKLDNVRAKLVSACAVDGPGGKRLFSQADVKALGEKSAIELNRVFDVAQRLSGLRDEDIEELSKNSESDLSGDSTSD